MSGYDKRTLLKSFNRQLDELCVSVGRKLQRLSDQKEVIERQDRGFYNEGESADTSNTKEIEKSEGKLEALLIRVQAVRDSIIHLLVVNPFNTSEEMAERIQSIKKTINDTLKENELIIVE